MCKLCFIWKAQRTLCKEWRGCAKGNKCESRISALDVWINWIKGMLFDRWESYLNCERLPLV